MKIDSAANLLYANLTLELILVTCESLAIHRKRGRPPEVNIGKPEALLDSRCVVPLMAWLCQVIDGCGNLWISWNKYCLQKTFLKEKAVTALNSLLETTVSCDDEIPGERKGFRKRLSIRRLLSLSFCLLGKVKNKWVSNCCDRIDYVNHLMWAVLCMFILQWGVKPTLQELNVNTNPIVIVIIMMMMINYFICKGFFLLQIKWLYNNDNLLNPSQEQRTNCDNKLDVLPLKSRPQTPKLRYEYHPLSLVTHSVVRRGRAILRLTLKAWETYLVGFWVQTPPQKINPS